jgi:3-hydroxymyristoyl/3-hydroxydecanoyl-(acyl carrier protein) dehydratase
MDELDSTWTVPVDHPAFAGHFPGQPIVPGVVLLDHAIQLAGTWLNQPETTWRIDSAKFFHAVGPGTPLCFRLSHKASGAVAFKVSEDGRDVASGALTPTGT